MKKMREALRAYTRLLAAGTTRERAVANGGSKLRDVKMKERDILAVDPRGFVEAAKKRSSNHAPAGQRARLGGATGCR